MYQIISIHLQDTGWDVTAFFLFFLFPLFSGHEMRCHSSPSAQAPLWLQLSGIFWLFFLKVSPTGILYWKYTRAWTSENKNKICGYQRDHQHPRGGTGCRGQDWGGAQQGCWDLGWGTVPGGARSRSGRGLHVERERERERGLLTIK